eukprot:1345380-Amorphochlora_amoeboformis.AAC.1
MNNNKVKLQVKVFSGQVFAPGEATQPIALGDRDPQDSTERDVASAAWFDAGIWSGAKLSGATSKPARDLECGHARHLVTCVNIFNMSNDVQSTRSLDSPVKIVRIARKFIL